MKKVNLWVLVVCMIGSWIMGYVPGYDRGRAAGQRDASIQAVTEFLKSQSNDGIVLDDFTVKHTKPSPTIDAPAYGKASTTGDCSAADTGSGNSIIIDCDKGK